MIERILPRSVAVAEAFESDGTDTPLSQQHTVTVNPAECWTAECDAAHPCGRVALERLAWPTGPVLWSGCVAPPWPNQPLSGDGLLDLVAYDEERDRMADLAARIPDMCWDRLLFSAELTVYKEHFHPRRWPVAAAR